MFHEKLREVAKGLPRNIQGFYDRLVSEIWQAPVHTRVLSDGVVREIHPRGDHPIRVHMEDDSILIGDPKAVVIESSQRGWVTKRWELGEPPAGCRILKNLII